jgi:hypothetical protein
MHIIFWWRSYKERDQYEDKRKWDDNINMDLTETGWGGMDGIDLAEDRNLCQALVNRVMNLRIA